MSHRSLLAGLVMLTLFVSAAQAQKVLTVSAGEFDRRGSVVPVSVGDALKVGVYELSDGAGDATLLQVGPGGRGSLIIGELKAGRTRNYRVRPAPANPADAGVRVGRDGGTLKVSSGGRDILHYQGAKTALPPGYESYYERGGYIHPVLTPGGRLVTDDFPPKHKHHHGIWSPWTKTKFEGRTPDFWNMFQKTGTVEVVDFGGAWDGPVAGGFTAAHRMVDLSANPPKSAINERWDVVAYRPPAGPDAPAYHLFDWTTTQTCATDSPLVLPKYHYGGLGFRGHRDWDGKGNCVFLTSEGKGRADGNETTGKWCHIGGKVDGEPAGVAILCHPDNFRFPQPMRLHPEEPFFCFAPSQGGDWSIEPGKPYVARYRFIVADGPADAKEIDRLWNDYAHPPKVTVE